ncbi:MAG: hypothetical protein LUG44_05445 [Clostridiales bacterium]|nr:hypothetical protein [Clostridiales bacterium]
MTTKEIIDRLDSLLHHPYLSDLCEDAEGTRETGQTLTAAIQAVELLEEIETELYDECYACAHHDCPACKNPCLACLDDDGDHWEFRWPLGEEKHNET